MADHGRALTVLGPVAARHVFIGRQGPSVGRRASENVMLVDDEQPTRNAAAIFGAAKLDIDLVLVGVKVIDTRGDLLPLSVHPRPLANAIARIDGRFPAFRLSAEIGAPRLAACTCLCRQILAVFVGAFDATKIGSSGFFLTASLDRVALVPSDKSKRYSVYPRT